MLHWRPFDEQSYGGRDAELTNCSMNIDRLSVWGSHVTSLAASPLIRLLNVNTFIRLAWWWYTPRLNQPSALWPSCFCSLCSHAIPPLYRSAIHLLAWLHVTAAWDSSWAKPYIWGVHTSSDANLGDVQTQAEKMERGGGGGHRGRFITTVPL